MRLPDNRPGPGWILIAQSLPLAIYLLLCLNEYGMVERLLGAAEQQEWNLLFTGSGVLFGLSLCYAALLYLRQRTIEGWYVIGASILHIGFMFLLLSVNRLFYSDEVPSWLRSGNIFFFTLTFFLPLLFLGVYWAVRASIHSGKIYNPWLNLLYLLFFVVGIGGLWMLGQTISPWEYSDNNWRISMLLVSLATWGFTFFLSRWAYLLVTQKQGWFQRYQWIFSLLFALVLPLTGLFINQSGWSTGWQSGSGGILGDFSHPAFIVLTVVNAALLCIPPLRKRWANLLLLAGQCATLPFTLYFFLVLLPFTPLSLVAVFFFGLGFILLSPSLLLMIHLLRIARQLQALRSQIPSLRLALAAVLPVLIIPVAVTISYYQDRILLHRALAFADEPFAEWPGGGRTAALEKVIDRIQAQKNQRPGFDYEPYQQPYLTRYYQWLVLDNLTLSEARIASLRSLFFDAPVQATADRLDEVSSNRMVLDSQTVESVYDEAKQEYTTWVHLRIRHRGEEGGALFTTRFHLPEGCFINNYYLGIGNRKEYGLLAERKAADFIFRQIVDVRRDPGLLRYSGPDELELRAFPFAANETRQTGICFTHREPLSLTIEGKQIALAPKEPSPPGTPLQVGGLHYLPASQKQALPGGQRKPYLHFLVDASASMSLDRLSMLMERIHRFSRQHPEVALGRKVSFVDMQGLSNHNLSPDAPLLASMQLFHGGYNLQKAMRQVLSRALLNQENRYPVLIPVTDDFSNALLGEGVGDLVLGAPESDRFYVLDSALQLSAHSLTRHPRLSLPDTVFTSLPTRLYRYGQRSFYLPDNGEPSVVVTQQNPLDTLLLKAQPGRFAAGLLLKGWHRQTATGIQPANEMWPQLLRLSFATGLLDEVTAYLALENEGQKLALQQKQAAVLRGHHGLDAGEEETPMPEPEEWALLFLLPLLLLARRRKKAL